MPSNITSPLSSSECTFNVASVDVAFSCLAFLLFPIAFLLNAVAAWVSLHLRTTSTFIVYLKNLVVADLLMTLTLPPMATSVLPGASTDLKVFTCRYSDVIFYCCLYTSIALMGLISLDRFFKIVRPCGKVFGQNLMFSRVMSSSVWFVIFGSTAIPTVILTDQNPTNDTTKDFCMSLKSAAGVTLHKFVVLFMEILFWFVSILVVFCYICITMKVLQSFRKSASTNSQGKKKTKIRVFFILFVFFVCFLPLHMIRIPFTLNETLEEDSCSQIWVSVSHKFVLWLSTTNTCLDPLLYISLCQEYKEKLIEIGKATGIWMNLRSKESQILQIKK
ncbi:P2Y purinoceptor 13-like [Thalassophryne amazonica]|uniref:P2Y purinoceptor 13-like n=1 Tax=Thalassophryne amazonica TaxID=390379 RepID=UPI001470FD23|nr:P2Y purinoceptor 13-like [Thalassophryne amazonica]